MAPYKSIYYLLLLLFVVDDYTGCADLEPKYMYYVNDGVYGSFNGLLFDHATVEAQLVDPEVRHYYYYDYD